MCCQIKACHHPFFLCYMPNWERTYFSIHFRDLIERAYSIESPTSLDVRFLPRGGKNKIQKTKQFWVFRFKFSGMTFKDYCKLQTSYQKAHAIALIKLTEVSRMIRIFATTFSVHFCWPKLNMSGGWCFRKSLQHGTAWSTIALCTTASFVAFSYYIQSTAEGNGLSLKQWSLMRSLRFSVQLLETESSFEVDHS